MSAKQQIIEAAASLPENTSLQEAFDRLYGAFKEKLQREAAAVANTPDARRRASWDALFGAGGTSDAAEVRGLLDPLGDDPALERATR